MFGHNCTPVSCEPRDLFLTPKLEPNSDIAGIGVLMGFVGTSYLAFLLLLANYLVVYDPRQNVAGFNPIDDLFLNHVRLLPKLAFPRLQLPFSLTNGELTSAIMNMCDIQIVTGLGILAGGVASLDCSLSTYHWEMIVRLAWFASVTHLAGIASLRSHLHFYTWERSIRLALMSVLLICLVAAMIPTGFFNWGNEIAQATELHVSNTHQILNHHDSGSMAKSINEGLWSAATPGSTAWCFFDIGQAKKDWSTLQKQICESLLHHDYYDANYYYFDDGDYYDYYLVLGRVPPCGQMYSYMDFYPKSNRRAPSPPTILQTTAMQSMIFSLSFLLFSFFARCLRLFPSFSLLFTNKVRAPLSERARIMTGAIRLQLTIGTTDCRRANLIKNFVLFQLLRLIIAIHLCLRFYLEFFLSKLAEILGHLLLLVWGTMNIITTRRKIPEAITEIENQWTFGQVVPATILIAPLLSTVLQLVAAAQANVRKPNPTVDPPPSSSPQSLQMTWKRTADYLDMAQCNTPISPSGIHRGSGPSRALSANALSTKALLYSIIPCATGIGLVIGCTFYSIIGFVYTVPPLSWIKHVLLFNVLVEQPTGNVLYHLMVLTVLDRRGDSRLPLTRIGLVNMYGAGMQASLSMYVLIHFAGRYTIYAMIVSVGICVDLLHWVSTSRVMRKEGRVPGLLPIQ